MTYILYCCAVVKNIRDATFKNKTDQSLVQGDTKHFLFHVKTWVEINILRHNCSCRSRHFDLFEPPHDKTNKMACAPSEDSDQPGHPLSTWRNNGFSATHWAHSENSDQTGWMPRLIWLFAGRIVILLILSLTGSFVKTRSNMQQFLGQYIARTGKHWSEC